MKLTGDSKKTGEIESREKAGQVTAEAAVPLSDEQLDMVAGGVDVTKDKTNDFRFDFNAMYKTP